MEGYDIKKALSGSSSYTFTSTKEKSILYALSIGFNRNQLNTDHFKFTYELDENFQTFFTYFAIVGHDHSRQAAKIPGIPKFDVSQLLHGEEYCEINKPLPTEGTFKCVSKIIDVQDKGKMMLLISENQIQCEKTGEVYGKIITTTVVRGLGGFGHKGTFKSPMPNTPKRAPDAVVEEPTQPNQAMLYRLNGDPNPIHINPQVSGMVGFEKPIIHGLCSIGFSGKAVYDKYCNGDSSLVKKWNVRFTNHVFPGETYVVEMWKEGNVIIFETKTKERGKVALKGYVELRGDAKM